MVNVIGKKDKDHKLEKEEKNEDEAEGDDEKWDCLKLLKSIRDEKFKCQFSSRESFNNLSYDQAKNLN